MTSPTGAVIRDILHRLADRFPRRVLVWPVRVQGEGAAEEIAAAIRGFNALPKGAIPRPDLLIVARGGGSIEDLWSFNEEIVVRAAAASLIPLISAVGHETDVTLIDFAADRRAPTPTAAAEMAVPVSGRADRPPRRPGAPDARLLGALPGAPPHRAARRIARAADRRDAAGAAAPAPRRRRRPAAARAHRQCPAAPRGAIARSRRGSTPQTAAHPDRAQSRAAARLRGARRPLHAGPGERRRERFAAASVRLAASLRANAEAQRGAHRARARARRDAAAPGGARV